MIYGLLLLVPIIAYVYIKSETCLLGHKPELMRGTPYVKCRRCPQTMNWMTGKMTWR